MGLSRVTSTVAMVFAVSRNRPTRDWVTPDLDSGRTQSNSPTVQMMTSRQRDRTMQEYLTSLTPAATLDAAKSFFSRRNSIYSAFLEQESERHITMRGQGGEEIVIGVAADASGTRVTGSSYLFDQQVARFFSTLPPAEQGKSATPAIADVAQQTAHP